MTRFSALAVLLGAYAMMLVPSVLADEWNKKTVLTVEEPIQVPGATLQPGRYVMKLADSVSDRHIVQIFNADENHLITTILAIPNYRLEPGGKTVVSFWETPPGQPKALRAWFYPGDNFGQEFAYPKTEATTIASNAQANVPMTSAANESEYKSAPVTAMSQRGQEQPLAEEYHAPAQTMEVAQSTPPAAAPAPMAATQQQDDADRSLPKTASLYPLIALAGLVSLGLFATLRLTRAR